MRKEELFCQALRMLTKLMPDTVVLEAEAFTAEGSTPIVAS